MPSVERLNTNLAGSASGAAAVDLSSTDATWAAPVVPTRLFIGTGGNVKVDVLGGGSGITFKNLANASYLNVAVTKVYKTGTTAADIVALFQDPI